MTRARRFIARENAGLDRIDSLNEEHDGGQTKRADQRRPVQRHRQARRKSDQRHRRHRVRQRRQHQNPAEKRPYPRPIAGTSLGGVFRGRHAKTEPTELTEKRVGPDDDTNLTVTLAAHQSGQRRSNREASGIGDRRCNHRPRSHRAGEAVAYRAAGIAARATLARRHAPAERGSAAQVFLAFGGCVRGRGLEGGALDPSHALWYHSWESPMTAEYPTEHPADAGTSLPPSTQRTQRGADARLPDDEDTMDLGRYVRAFERRWKLAVVGALVGGTIAFSLASLRAVRYKGVTTLLVVPPLTANVPLAIQMTPATFRSIVENTTLAKQVIEELKLRDITPQQFVEQSLEVEEVRGTNIVKVKVQLPEAGVAAEASHRTAVKAILLTESVSQQAGASIQDQLKAHKQREPAPAKRREGPVELQTERSSGSGQGRHRLTTE